MYEHFKVKIFKVCYYKLIINYFEVFLFEVGHHFSESNFGTKWSIQVFITIFSGFVTFQNYDNQIGLEGGISYAKIEPYMSEIQTHELLIVSRLVL